MATGARWRSRPQNFGRSVEAKVYELTRDKAIRIFNYCVELSPVDTGSYRASWRLSEGSPDNYWVGRQPEVRTAMRFGRGTPLAPPRAPVSLSTKFYRKFYVSNGAPYARALEYGWSSQAPFGVLRSAIKYA